MRITGPGIWGPPRDRAAARALLRRAVDLGVQLIDTADAYGPGVSEELIAEALFPYDGLLIATKGGYERTGPSGESATGELIGWTPNGRPDHLRSACEASLRQLRLDRIDLYQLHTPDPAGFQKSATSPDLGLYAARSYSLMRPPRTGRRWIRSWKRSTGGWSGRGGRSWRLRGRGWVWRSTATSCRSTKSSASLEADDRPSRISQPQSLTKMK
jgi:hypothetical protein